MQGLAVAERAYQQSLGVRAGAAAGPGDRRDRDGLGDHRVPRRAPDAHDPEDVPRGAAPADAAATPRTIDHSTHEPDEAARVRADEIVDLLTPICKAFGTDLGNEVTSLALQIHGGMGFIEETGVAQHYRDARIAAIYEGTNGIQAIDLVGRKLGVRGGASFLEFIATMREIEPELAAAGADFDSIREELTPAVRRAGEGHRVDARAPDQADPNAVLAGSMPYLRMWGLCLGGWLMARSALAGPATGDSELADTQLVLARFYAEQLLPQAVGPAQCGDRRFPRPVRAGCGPAGGRHAPPGEVVITAPPRWSTLSGVDLSGGRPHRWSTSPVVDLTVVYLTGGRPHRDRPHRWSTLPPWSSPLSRPPCATRPGHPARPSAGRVTERR